MKKMSVSAKSGFSAKVTGSSKSFTAPKAKLGAIPTPTSTSLGGKKDYSKKKKPEFDFGISFGSTGLTGQS